MNISLLKSLLLFFAVIISPCFSDSSSFFPSKLPAHPRIRVTDAQLAQIKKNIEKHEDAKALSKDLLAYAETIIPLPMVDCVPSGSNGALLSSSRKVLDHVYTLGLSYRLTGDERYANRTVKELLYVSTPANCPKGWNPANFLAVSEMMHAVSIGYDWLYGFMSEEQRKIIEGGLLNNGLNAGAHSFATNEWWSHFDDNWNIVCNIGIAYGVIALADVQPILANKLWTNLTSSIHHGLGVLAPDGAWTEGPMYWGYALEYLLSGAGLVVSIPELNSSWLSTPGLAGSGEFEIHMVGPSGNVFNWGDVGGNTSILYNPLVATFQSIAKDAALATDVERKVYSFIGREWVKARADCSSMVCAFSLLAFSEQGSFEDLQSIPTAKFYPTRHIGSFRSAWGPSPFLSSSSLMKMPAWLAFKGNNGTWTHNDLDGGQWVLELGGVGWAVDLGSDSYGLPGYWNQKSGTNQRYSWYRKSTHGHNTLTFGGWDTAPSGTVALGRSNQAFNAGNKVSVFKAGSNSTQPHYAIVELTDGYKAQGAVSVRRGFAFLNSFTQLIIVDEFDFDSAPNVTWAMHTPAVIEIKSITTNTNNTKAELKKDGRVLEIQVIESPVNGVSTFSKRALDLKPPQEPLIELINKLTLTSTNATGRFVVSLSLSTDPQPPVRIRPLAQWAKQGPIE